jgi:hypothetical protein
MNAIIWALASSAVRALLMAGGVWLAAHGYLTDGGSGWQAIIGDIMALAGAFFSGKNAIDQGKLNTLMEDILKNIAWLHPGTTSVQAAAKAVAESAPPKVVTNFSQAAR